MSDHLPLVIPLNTTTYYGSFACKQATKGSWISFRGFRYLFMFVLWCFALFKLQITSCIPHCYFAIVTRSFVLWVYSILEMYTSITPFSSWFFFRIFCFQSWYIFAPFLFSSTNLCVIFNKVLFAGSSFLLTMHVQRATILIFQRFKA